MKKFAERAVLLSPHIDDVPFSLGAAILDGRFQYATVMNVFSISQSAYDDDAVERVSAARRLEDQQFFRNVKMPIESLYLDRLDAPLRLGISDDDVFAISPPMSDWDEVRHIRLMLEAIRPRRSLLIAPLALGHHVDHVVVHRAACDAAIDGWQVAFYEDAPYAFDLTLGEIQQIVEETSNTISRYLKPYIFPYGHSGCSKEETLAVYRSQLRKKSIDCIRGHASRLGDAAERIWGMAICE